MTTQNSSGLIVPRSLVLLLAVTVQASCATSPGVEKEAKPADLEALKAVGAKAGGLVAWTSGRDGLPHIFTMKTDGSDLKQVTEGPYTDWYPRFSPDGKKILFSRSQKKGFVRQSEASTPGTWSLYTVDVGGTGATKIVEDASWGSWASADEIVFLRDGKIVRAKLDASGESDLVDVGDQPILAGAIVQQPQLSTDGKYLTLTLAGGRRQVGIWKIKKKIWTQTGSGAQIGWAPDGASVLWVSPTGMGLSEILRMPVEHGVPAKDLDKAKLPLFDSPGKRSREAFPRLSGDGKWLVFGAGSKSLEQDLEDFELYLWEVGTPVETTVRLTFHTGNDSWPDIFVPGGATPPATTEGDEKSSPPAEEKKAPPESTGDKADKPETESAPKTDEAAPPSEEKPADEEAPAFKSKGKGAKKKKR